MAKKEVIHKSVEQLSNNLKQSAWFAILESLAMVVLGVLLIAWPDVVIKAVAYVVGLFFVIKGAYQIINYFMVKGQNDFFNNDLLMGVISVLVGIAALVVGEGIASVFRIVIGVFLVYEALVRMNTSLKLYTAGISNWKYVMIIALLMMVIGIFITFYEGAVLTLIGWMMIISGVVGIFSDAMFIQNVNNLAEKITGSIK